MPSSRYSCFPRAPPKCEARRLCCRRNKVSAPRNDLKTHSNRTRVLKDSISTPSLLQVMLSRCSRSLAAVAAKASATAATATAAATAAAAASVSASRSFATLRARTAVASAKNRSSSPLATASLPVSLALCRSSLRLISSGRKSSRNVTSVPAAHSHSSAAAAATANVTPLPPPTPPTAAASAAAGTDAEVPWYLSGPELDLNFVVRAQDIRISGIWRI